MSSGLGKGVGVPVKLLHESEGHVVTVREDSPIIARERGETRDARRETRRRARGGGTDSTGDGVADAREEARRRERGTRERSDWWAEG